MIKIEGDDLIKVTSGQDWSNATANGPGLRITVEASNELRNLMYTVRKLQTYEHDLNQMHKEWFDMKKMIDSNPAVKANWEEFQTLLGLATEQNE